MLFDRAASDCEQILEEHRQQLIDLAEYLLIHETMEGEQFNYYFEHGEFMPESVKQAKLASKDKTIERPARKISMSDEAPEAPQLAEECGETQPAAEQESAPQPEPSDENQSDKS